MIVEYGLYFFLNKNTPFSYTIFWVCMYGAPLTISVRQAVIAARHSVMLAYGRPVYRQSQRQVLKSF